MTKIQTSEDAAHICFMNDDVAVKIEKATSHIRSLLYKGGELIFSSAESEGRGGGSISLQEGPNEYVRHQISQRS